MRRFPLGGLSETEAQELQNLPVRNEGPVRFASIGRLVGWKGFGLGLKAFAMLLKELPDSEYWIVGSGPDRGWLEKLARELGCAGRVRFMDWMPRASILAVYSEIDVLVHPSYHEQFGYVVLEAMAAGRPVVCLASGGCGELAAGGGGIVVPLSTPDRVVPELCRALRDLALDRSHRQATGERARRWATEHWNWSRVGDRLAAAYQQVLQRESEFGASARLETAGQPGD